MNQQKPAVATESSTPKRSITNPFRKDAAANADGTVNTKDLKSKAKTGLAYVGAAALTVGGVLYIVKKKTGVDTVSAEVTLPSIDTSTES